MRIRRIGLYFIKTKTQRYRFRYRWVNGVTFVHTVILKNDEPLSTFYNYFYKYRVIQTY